MKLDIDDDDNHSNEDSTSGLMEAFPLFVTIMNDDDHGDHNYNDDDDDHNAIMIMMTIPMKTVRPV